MGSFSYNGQLWIFENETLLVRMDDATFQKHLTAYLASKDIDTRTHLQLQAYIDQVLNLRIAATRHLENPEYWRNIDDPNVRVSAKYGQRRRTLPS